MEIKIILEAVLFAADRPLNIGQLQSCFPENGCPGKDVIRATLDAICEDYRERSVELKEVASGYRFQVRKEYSFWVSSLFVERPVKYSRALLETLSIIAYKQPATRGVVEGIRGVSVSSSIIRTLLEREWIRVVGHKEVPGRPALYATTKEFLDYFNLKALDGLPALNEFQLTDSTVGSDNSLVNMPVDEPDEATL